MIFSETIGELEMEVGMGGWRLGFFECSGVLEWGEGRNQLQVAKWMSEANDIIGLITN